VTLRSKFVTLIFRTLGGEKRKKKGKAKKKEKKKQKNKKNKTTHTKKANE